MKGEDIRGSQMNTRKKLNRGAYIEGTAVRKLSQYEQAVPDEMPGRHYAPEKRQQAPKRKTSENRPKPGRRPSPDAGPEPELFR